MRIDPVGPPLATLKLDLALEFLSSRRPASLLPAAPHASPDALSVTEAARALAAGAPSPAVLRLLIALVDRAAVVPPGAVIEAPVAMTEGVRTVAVTATRVGGTVLIAIDLRPTPPGGAPSLPFDGRSAQLDGQRFLLTPPAPLAASKPASALSALLAP